MIASEKDCRIKEDGSIVNENNRISDDEGYESDESCEGYDNNDDSSDGESDTDFVDFVNIVDDPNAKKGFDPMDISLLAKSITANPKFREWKMDEPFRRGTVLSTESIDLVMRTKKCPPFRKSEACVNGNCLDLLGSVSAARESVISLRSSFFQPKGTVSFRKGTLINKLREHIITDEDNRPHIQYMVQGSSKQVKVCKGFYRMASGVPKKMFDAIVSCVECTTTNHRIVDCCNNLIEKGVCEAVMGYTDSEKRRKAVEYMSGKNLKINEERVAHVTNFLDTYFDSSADMAPEGRDVRVIHFTYHELYVQYYIPYCSDPLTFRKCAVDETDFYKIRKAYRPYYKRSKEIKRGGFNHVRCEACANFKMDIFNAKTTEEKEEARTLFKLHLEKQNAYRDLYTMKTLKVAHRKDHLSLIVDAAGGTGTTYQPRFMEVIKGEPPRHTVLKTKQTFAVIHGIGTFVYTSYPKITKQGANLTVEVILRAVQEAFERRNAQCIEGVKITCFKRIYIQVDSTPANKCYVVLLALAALLLMGVTDKITLAYLLLGHTHTDVDRIIGYVTTAMRLHDITDPDTFERLVQESFVEERLKTTPRKVERMIGITDYEKLFDSKAANKEQQIKYLHTVSKFMLIRDKTGKKVHLYYKHDSRAPGWLPKPVIVTNSYNATWDAFSACDMAPQQIMSYAPVKDEINGRAWKYDVLHMGGERKQYILPVIPIVLNISMDGLSEKIENAPQQVFEGPMLKRRNRRLVKANLNRLLDSHRVKDKEIRSQWDDIFKSFPRSAGHQCAGKDHPRILHSIVHRYQNEIPLMANEHVDADQPVIWDEMDLDLVTSRNVGLPPKEIIALLDAELKKKGKKRKYTRHTNDNDDFSGESDDGSAVSGDSNDLFESYENSNIANEQPKSKRTSKRDVVVKPKTKKSIKAIKHEELDGKDHVSLGTSTSHAGVDGSTVTTKKSKVPQKKTLVNKDNKKEKKERTGRTEENEFEDGSDSSVGDKYEGEEETPKKNKSKTTPLLTKPDKEVAPLFGTSEDILRFEVDFLLSLENLRGVSEDMEIQMEIFSLSKASENALEFDKAHRMRNGLHLLSDGVNMKGWTSKDIKVFLLDSDLKFVLLRRSQKTVSQLYNGAKPDGLCNLRTLLLLLERRRRFNAGRSDYNDVKDLDMTIPEDRISLLEHIKIWIAKVEGKYGIITEEDQRVWTNQSSDVIKKLKCASKYVENISLLKSGSRIPSLGPDGWMIIDLTGFYDYDDCRVTVFEPLTKKDEETLFRLHFCGGYLHNSYSFPLRLIQEMTKQSNNCIFKDCHFFPLKTHPDDESHLFDLTLDNYCERLYDFLKINAAVDFAPLPKGFAPGKDTFCSTYNDNMKAIYLHQTPRGVDHQLFLKMISTYEAVRLKNIIRNANFMRNLGFAKQKQVKPINPMASGVDSVAAADVPIETNLEPETVIGIKRERPIRKAAATASQRIIDLSSPTKKSSPTKNSTPTKSTVVLGEDDTLNTGSTTVLREEDIVINKKKKRTSVVTCVEEPWEAAAIMKKDSKNLSRLVAKYKGKLFRDKVKKVWEDRVIIGVLWKSEHDQYIVNTDLTTGMDEAEYDIFSVRELII